MSKERIRENGNRWLRQAKDDLSATDALIAAERYAQACFWAQQAAEKALKAYWITLDREPWGHSVTRLIDDLPQDEKIDLGSLREEALYLDKMYIPTRYPDAIADLTPGEAYTRHEAQTALRFATSFVDRVAEYLESDE